MPKIAIVPAACWAPACHAHGVAHVELPMAGNSSDGLYAADLHARTVAGRLALNVLEHEKVDLILDRGAAGLTFVEGPGGFADLKLTHEYASVPLVSHLTDPIHALNRGLPWDVIWSCLGSRRWVKVVADANQAEELRRFGIDNVVHVPIGAVEYPYETSPLRRTDLLADVGFIGDASSVIFAGLTDEQCESEQEFIRGECAGSQPEPFFAQYHDKRQPVDPPSPADSDQERSAKARAYFQSRIRRARRMCIEHRDRYVARLREQWGPSFRLMGRGWPRHDHHQLLPLPKTMARYVGQFRVAAVNLCLWDGTNDSTISAQHFEIAAAGGFLLCHDHSELTKYFEVGSECDTFRDEQELVDKIRYYVANDARRERIARAGQQRALRDHLYRHRLRDILGIMERVRQRAAAAAFMPSPHLSELGHSAPASAPAGLTRD